eukprot:COSAG06_NODE_23843_length_680_cov_0.693632_1_plen_226_part_11
MRFQVAEEGPKRLAARRVGFLRVNDAFTDTYGGAAVWSFQHIVVDGAVAIASGGFVYSQSTMGTQEVDYAVAVDCRANDAGGVFLIGVPTRVRHSQFQRNTATTIGGVFAVMYSLADSGSVSLDVAYSTFVANTAIRGGAIYTGTEVIVKVHLSSFTNNRALGAGGAIATAAGTSLEVLQSQFEFNAAPGVGSALNMPEPASFKILDTTFTPFIEGSRTVFVSGQL